MTDSTIQNPAFATAESLFAKSGELATEFRTAQPWPHLLLTDLLPPELVRSAFEQERERLASIPSHRTHRQAKAATTEGFGPAATAILEFLDGPEVVQFLREVTGISDLRSDPTHYWAGLHANGPGHFHALHRDFPRHPVNKLWHRINILVYLNPEWPESYGGQLELWKRGGREPGRVVQPHAPNVVVFETDAAAIHGLPTPIACPEGEARLSLNCFYYSEQPPRGRKRMELIRRPRRPQDPWTQGIATWPQFVNGVQERTPDKVKDLRRQVMNRINKH